MYLRQHFEESVKPDFIFFVFITYLFRAYKSNSGGRRGSSWSGNPNEGGVKKNLAIRRGGEGGEGMDFFLE